MAHETCETVAVACDKTADNDAGFYIVNKTDYDAMDPKPALYVEPAAPDPAPKDAKASK